MALGKVVQVIGPVVDVRFAPEVLPGLRESIEIHLDRGGHSERLVLEVAQHLGENLVRTVAMDSTDGLVRGMPVQNTGEPIQMPAGSHP